MNYLGKEVLNAYSRIRDVASEDERKRQSGVAYSPNHCTHPLATSHVELKSW